MNVGLCLITLQRKDCIGYALVGVRQKVFMLNVKYHY